jgi:hypothetical protein
MKFKGTESVFAMDFLKTYHMQENEHTNNLEKEKLPSKPQ